ncbi:MAG: hypothetical protein ACOCRX_07930 [Candidatus Woesearchaeota archaeon]
MADIQKIFGMVVIAAGWFFGVAYIMFFATPDVLTPYMVREQVNMSVFTYCNVERETGVPSGANEIGYITASSTELDNVCNQTCHDKSMGDGRIRNFFFQDMIDGRVCVCSEDDNYC